MKICMYIFFTLFLFSITSAEKQWVQKHYDKNENVTAFKTIDSNRIVALVGDAGHARVYKSYDAGNSWNKTSELDLANLNDSVFNMTPSYIHDSLNYYLCFLERVVILKTEDGGDTFTWHSFGDISSKETFGIEDIKMYDNNIGCAITFGHVIWTRDNWKTYEVFDTPEEYYFISSPMFFLDSSSIAMKLYRSQGNQFLSFDVNTEKWDKYSVEVKAKEGENIPTILEVHFFNDTLGIGVGAQKTTDPGWNIYYELIWKTTDKGVHWDIIYKDIQYPRFGLTHLDFYENKGIACTDGKVMISSDYGDTWEYCNAPVEFWNTIFWDCTYCGDYPIIWFHANGAYRYEEVTGITEGIFEEIEVTPHQSEREYYIEISDPESREYKIRISDLNGRTVLDQTLSTLVSTESTHIDLSSLEQGTYVCFITCNSSLIYSGKFVNVR